MIEKIIQTADNEVLIEVKMNELKQKWDKMQLTFTVHTLGDVNRGFVLEKTEPIIQNIEEDCIQLQIILTSP